MVKHKIHSKQKHGTTLEQLALVVAIIEPLSTLPQILDIYETQNAEALSLTSWLLFMGASIIWLAYGIKLRNLPLIASSVLWVATELTLITQIIIYS